MPADIADGVAVKVSSEMPMAAPTGAEMEQEDTAVAPKCFISTPPAIMFAGQVGHPRTEGHFATGPTLVTRQVH